MKFGLMTYDYTTNLGNEIQSIAARRFLPKIDYAIDHERLNLFKCQEKVKLIMNAWYLDCLSSWPPSHDIEPLLISMHFNTSVNETKEIILAPNSKEFFSSYGPVGCRDYSTLRLLEENDVDAYFSGCLSLTLDNSFSQKNTSPYIVVNVHNSSELIEFLKTKTDLPIYDIYQLSTYSFDKKYIKNKPSYYKKTSLYNFKEKLFLAENLLTIYENASCVITDRVHCAFPCLALKTPVLFFSTAKYGPERLDGVSQFLRQTTFDEYKQDYSFFDVEKPKKNPEEYLKIRKTLIKKTKDFTGHINDSYLLCDDENRLNRNIELIANTSRKTRKYIEDVDRTIDQYKKEIAKQNDIIAKQNRIIEDFEKSKDDKRNFLKKLIN